MYGFDKSKLRMSNKAKQNKSVIIMSTFHKNRNANQESEKLKMIQYYNSKIVDRIHIKSDIVECKRNICERLLCVFYDMINIV